MVSWFSSPQSPNLLDYYAKIDCSWTKNTWQLPATRSWGSGASTAYRISTIALMPILLVSDLFVSLLELSVGNALVLVYNLFSRAYYFLLVKEPEPSLSAHVSSFIETALKTGETYYNNVTGAIKGCYDNVTETVKTHYQNISKTVTTYYENAKTQLQSPLVTSKQFLQTHKFISYPLSVAAAGFATYLLLRQRGEHFFQFYWNAISAGASASLGTWHISKGLLFMSLDTLQVIKCLGLSIFNFYSFFNSSWILRIPRHVFELWADFGHVTLGVYTLALEPACNILIRLINPFKFLT